MFKELVEKTQKACDALGVNVQVEIKRCEDTGRFYLAGSYLLPMVFDGEVHRMDTDIIEEIYRGDCDGTFKLFMMHFNKNRVAYINATNDKLLEYKGHPDLFQPS